MPRHFVHLLKVARYAICAGLLALAALPVHATLITFAEFPYTPTPGDEETWYGDPVGEDYAGLGVHISGAWRVGFTVGGPGDSLVGGDSPSITFTGTLPTFVSVNFISIYDVAAFVSAWAPHGLVGTISTGGWDISPEGEWTETPLNNYASFHSPDGISGLSFSNVYGSRLTVQIDNLYFGAVPPAPVPEPGSLALWVAGLGVVGVARGRRRLVSRVSLAVVDKFSIILCSHPQEATS